MVQGYLESVKMVLQCNPWRPKAKRGEELCGGDASEMDRGMCNQAMVVIDHANDVLTAFISDAHLKDPIQHSGKDTLVVQSNSDLDVMMFIKKPSAENSNARLGCCDPTSDCVSFPCSITHNGAEVRGFAHKRDR